MKKFLVGATAVAVLSGALYAFGPGYGGFGGCGMDGKMEGKMGRSGGMSVLSDLNLSAEQKKEIRKLIFERKEAMLDEKPNRKNIAIALDKNGNFDKEAFIKNTEKLHDEMVEKKAELFEKVLKVLTAEQKKELASKLEKAKG